MNVKNLVYRGSRFKKKRHISCKGVGCDGDKEFR